MAWPTDGKAATLVEMYIGGVWTDITSYVRHDAGIDVTRSISPGSSRAEPGSMRLTLDNRDGRFDPRNPTGPYYGLIGRNTQVRYSLSEGQPWVVVVSSGASTPDAAALELAGDLDARIEITVDDPLTGGPDRAMCGKWGASGDYAWHLSITGGLLKFTWSANSTTTASLVCAVKVSTLAGKPTAYRVAVDANNGAGVGTATFYESGSIDGTWVQLGDPVAHTTTISIDAVSAGLLYVGKLPGLASADGRVHRFELRNAAAALVADVDFGQAVPGDTEVVDDAGLTWTATSPFVNTYPRFCGEVAAWPIAFTKAGEDVWCSIEVSGPLRRLNQQPEATRSPLYRYLSTVPGLQAYWPMENPTAGDEFAEAQGRRPLVASPGVTISTTEPFTCSGALSLIGSSRLNGIVENYTGTGYVAVFMMLDFPSGDETVNSELFSLFTTGTSAKWRMEYDGAGAFTVYGYSQTISGGTGEAAPAPVLVSASWNVGMLNLPRLMMFELQQSGADVNVSLRVWIPGQTDWAWDFSDVLVGYTISRATSIEINNSRTIDGTYIGHVAIVSDEGSLYSDPGPHLDSNRGENSATRIFRVCGEEDVPIVVQGDEDLSAPMGYQPTSTPSEVIDDAALTDRGLLYESTSDLGLRYRTHGSSQAREPHVSVPWSFVMDAQPVDDDRDVCNQAVADSPAGWSARVSDPVSIAQVGLYEDSATVNPRYSDHMTDYARWMLAEGIVDARRWPLVTFELSRDPGLTSWTQTLSEFLTLDLLDRIRLTDTPAHVGYDDVDLVVTGIREFTNGYVYTMNIDCVPFRPLNVGRYDASRYDSGSSTLDAAINSVIDTFMVDFGDLAWVSDPAQFPFDVMIGGEVMTVLSITSADPQEFEVTRSVNGVVKSHAIGTPVSLADPANYGL